MKKTIKIILILLLIPLVLIMAVMGNVWYKKRRSYNEIYTTKSDKALAQVIENSINLALDLKKYDLSLTLDDIEYACYSKSVYGISAPEMLGSIGKENKYASLIEDKRQVGYGEGSSLFMFVKTNGEVIPIFVSAYFYEMKTNYNFQKGCVKTNNNKLNIKINSSLKEKALIVLE